MTRAALALALALCMAAPVAALYTEDGPVVLPESVEAFERDVLASSDSLWIVRALQAVAGSRWVPLGRERLAVYVAPCSRLQGRLARRPRGGQVAGRAGSREACRRREA